MPGTILINDTRTGEKRPLQPLYDDVRLFVCGPTVYDDSHIGHARTYIAFDVIARWIRHQGYFLRYIQNITDIDDKIIERAKREKERAMVLAKLFEKRYHEDMQALRVRENNIEYARASDYIYEILDQVGRLIDKDVAYSTSDGSVYFSVSSFSNYGNLSGQKIEEQQEATRIDLDQEKREPADFVIWRGRYESSQWEPTWDSPAGKGRPGWHIEDTAIAESEFGHQYDLHGGARDLIFPHHEGEIAIMESLSGFSPMVNQWMHTGILNISDEKMSKSKGNIITIRDILKDYSPESVRYLILQSHYRSPIDYKEDDLRASAQAVRRLHETTERLNKITGGRQSRHYKLFGDDAQKVSDAMNDDFNTPLALAAVFQATKRINAELDAETYGTKEAESALGFLFWIDDVFGIIPPEQTVAEDLPPGIQRLVDQREEARENKQWGKADKLRKELEQLGYHVRDTNDGPDVRTKQ